jgi:glycosyltransferase involved in cell wall biosynthesis
MLNQAEIAIVIPAYNSEAFIQYTLDSILKQSFKNFIVRVIDDGSTDNTVSIINAYAMFDERVKLIQGTHRLGMIANWNQCLKLAYSLQTPYYILLFHDDFLLSQFALEKAVALLENNSEIAAVYSEMVFVDSQGKSIMARQFGNKGVLMPAILAKKSIIAGRNLFGIPLLIRNDTLFEVDERLTYVGDIDISIMSAGNRKIYRMPEPLIAYRLHGKNATHGVFQQTLFQMEILADKHSITFNSYEKIIRRLNTWLIIWQKRLFFFYLSYLRNTRH